MPLTVMPESIPLKLDPEGTVRASGTRVTLETIVAVFNDGASAEAIVSRYPTLPLADVYFIVGYYLRHRAEVDAYIAQQERDADAVRAMIEARYPPDDLFERLLARRQALITP